MFEYMFLFWILTGLAFGFLELSSPGFFFFLSCSFGCFVAASLAWYQYTLVTQMVVAFFVMIFSLYILYALVKKYAFSQHSSEKHTTNIDALIGREALVLQKIIGKEYGLVKVRGEIWSAETDDDAALEINESVVVVRIYGNKLMVRRPTY
ncbi:NfeD family protein [Candidatus Babeliales bacterium]|nr:NfeD family protein [Candidatus Babeliales bacterium]